MASKAQKEDAEERRQRIVELSKQGLSSPTIASKLGVSRRTVERARNLAGMCREKRYGSEEDKLQSKMMLVDGCSYAEVGRTLGWDACTIEKWHPGYTFTKQQTGHASVMSRKFRRLERLTLVEKV